MTKRGYVVSFYLMVGVLFFMVAMLPCQECYAKIMTKEPRRFSFKIDPATPITELLPRLRSSPLASTPHEALLLGSDDLAAVPELTLGDLVAKDSDTEKEMAHVIARINHLNLKDPDGFMKAILKYRSDLRGLPYLLENSCRTEEKEAQLFAQITNQIQNKLNRLIGEEMAAETFWKQQQASYFGRQKPQQETNSVATDRVTVAALMQMMGGKSESYRIGLAKFLVMIEHADASRALARLALFAPEAQVRTTALEGLKSRNRHDYADVLMQGFRYPLGLISSRAAEAVVKLDCKDRFADLIKVLEEPDPRAPVKQNVDGKVTTVIREVVRVNHHRNCLLCHSPANTGYVPEGVLTAAVPLPDRGLKRDGGYLDNASPDIFVRIDITYLRQDFSLMLPVKHATPWPPVQRFDYFVRTRAITAEESATQTQHLAKHRAPSHVSATIALSELAGRAPVDRTPQAWRRLLKIP